MAMPKSKNTNGRLGTETAALREQIEQLTAAIEKMAKAEEGKRAPSGLR